MGFVRGQEVRSILNAPLKDPIKYEIMEYEVSLRRGEAVMIEVSMLKSDVQRNDLTREEWATRQLSDEGKTNMKHNGLFATGKNPSPEKKIKVAMVGNPNSGKTSIFNLASGAHERVGNYSGVTVDSKEGILKHNGYRFTLVDLPGTYSLSSYSPEELYARKYITKDKPDVIVNVVSASTLE